MAIQQFVSSEDLKKLVDDKIISTNNIKHILKKRGIFPVCNNSKNLSEQIYYLFLGSGFMTQIHQIMNFEQNNLKSTVVIISPRDTNIDENNFLSELSDEFYTHAKIPNSPYRLSNICHDDNNCLLLQYSYNKPQKGRISLADNKEITLHIKISPITNEKKFKVNIRHEGISDSKPFIDLLSNMSILSGDSVFSLTRVTVSSLLKTHKVDFFDNFASYPHTDWSLKNITNVTLNKDEITIDDDCENDETEQLTENEPSGTLSGINSAVLSGDGLRNNDFVKDCMEQNFIFSSMRYKLSHKKHPITIEIDVTFKHKDLKVIIVKTWRTEEDGVDYISPLSLVEQEQYIDYFQNVAYSVYSNLIKEQKKELQKS